MDFEVFIHPKIYNTIPGERRKQILSAILGLCDPFPDQKGDKKEVKGAEVLTYRLRVGGYRVFYQMLKELGKMGEDYNMVIRRLIAERNLDKLIEKGEKRIKEHGDKFVNINDL